MNPLVRRALLSLALLAMVGISWSSVLDRHAVDQTRAAFRHALVAFATARALNGAISVVQGTELALQPAGLGVTLAAGEVLDPLNDLVERFSWVMLMRAVSLGAQIVAQEVAMSPWSNWMVTIAAIIAIATFVAAQRRRRGSTQAARNSWWGSSHC